MGGRNGRICPFSPILATYSRHGNGMDMGEMLLSFISLYHGHERKSIWEEKCPRNQREAANFRVYEMSYT